MWERCTTPIIMKVFNYRLASNWYVTVKRFLVWDGEDLLIANLELRRRSGALALIGVGDVKKLVELARRENALYVVVPPHPERQECPVGFVRVRGVCMMMLG